MLDSKTEYVRARITADVKDSAELIFTKLGLGHTEAIRLFYQQVILNQGLPFEVRLPNATTSKVVSNIKAKKNLKKTTLSKLKKEFGVA